mmetsp:Transcript_65328/g.119127  ORF Transcript_65328/g.119127 Transcript_65328/m.119127 type:complete len:260 (+) Transcript_65328:84-863(+)
MRGLALLLVCVACVGYAHQVRTDGESVDDAQKLASLLLSLNEPSAAFKPPSASNSASPAKPPAAASSATPATSSRSLLTRRGALAAAPALMLPFVASAKKIPICERRDDGYWTEPCLGNKWRDKDDPREWQQGKYLNLKALDQFVEAKLDEGKRTMFMSFKGVNGVQEVAEGKTQDESEHLSFSLQGQPVEATWVGDGWTFKGGPIDGVRVREYRVIDFDRKNGLDIDFMPEAIPDSYKPPWAGGPPQYSKPSAYGLKG